MRLSSVAGLCNESCEAGSFKYKIRVKERIDIIECG